MSNLSIVKHFQYVICWLTLGKTYRITDIYGRQKDCLLIRTGSKGFNLLDIKKHKCLFRRPVYQDQSSKKTIGRRQTKFEMSLPNWITNIEGNPTGPTKDNLIDKYKTGGVVKREKVNVSKINIVYGMEIE